jgi:hypothetical protein
MWRGWRCGTGLPLRSGPVSWSVVQDEGFSVDAQVQKATNGGRMR